MGQQNDKVVFEGHQQLSTNRKHIFPKQNALPRETCDVPGCHCPLPHPDFNARVCSACQDDPPPFLRTAKPKYFEDAFVPAEPREQLINSPPKPEEPPQAESIPGRIPYYNAWSLPTHKYHIRERLPFEHAGIKTESSHLVEHDSRENVDTFIQKVSERIVRAVDAPKAELDRRQNMNLAD